MWEAFAQATLVEWILLAASTVWTIVKLGEWKHALESRRNGNGHAAGPRTGSAALSASELLLEARIKAAIVEASRQAKHDAVGEANAETGKLGTRLDRDVVSLWKEFNRQRETLDGALRLVADHGERLARVEGRR